jgi:hypothetical protein
MKTEIALEVSTPNSGFGGLAGRMLASGTQDRGFEADRSRRIFQATKSTTFLPSEGK